MKNEIIIDGIDVSKCQALFRPNLTCYNCYACEGSDCYFKQLKRKEFELKILKADYEASEQEIKNLKELNEKICKDWSEIIEQYWSDFRRIKEIINQKLDIKLIKLNGQAPMIFDADFHNKIKQPILEIINEVLDCQDI